MTHEAPPASDPRPQKVQKVDEPTETTPTKEPIAPTNGATTEPVVPTNEATTTTTTTTTTPAAASEPTANNGDSEPTPATTEPAVDTKPTDSVSAATASDDTKQAETEIKPTEAATNGDATDGAATEDLSQVTLVAYMSSRTSPPIVAQADLVDNKKTALPADDVAKFHSAVGARNGVCVLLAAGQGSRFVSDIPKVIHPLQGKALAQHALDAALACDLPVVVVVGHAKDQVAKTLIVPEDKKEQVVFVIQEETMGTGHAVYVASTALPKEYAGDIVVAYADNPGIDKAMLKSFVDAHSKFKEQYTVQKYGAMSVTGSRKHAGQGAANYGRVIRQNKTEDKENMGCVVDIVEKKTITKLAEDGQIKKYGDVEWSAKELEDVDEFNSGIVVACGKSYLEVLGDVKGSMTKKEPVVKYEYYATDYVKGLVSKGLVAEGFQVNEKDVWKLEGSNTVDELKELSTKMDNATKTASNDAASAAAEGKGDVEAK